MPPHGSSPRQEQSRRYYEKHRDKILEKRKQHRSTGRTNETKRNRCRENTLAARILKQKPCADCGVQYPPYVMDFDHVSGEKEANVAWLLRNDMSWAKIKAEIDKCEVVCSNCHRERTHQRKGGPHMT